MSNVLVIGATRGLGASLVQKYAAENNGTIFATSRSENGELDMKNVVFIPDIDISLETAGAKLLSHFKGSQIKLDVVIITAGYFSTETFDEPKWDEEVKMYTTSAIGPVFVIHSLVKGGFLVDGSKIILVSSESGSIKLRHESEGGGNYAHHASKSALNMVGRLLSLDLKDQGIAVGIVHPGFMRTDMTKGVGFDKFWDDGGAVTPDEAAASLFEFIQKFDLKNTGQYWAPRGPRDIGTAEAVLGKGLPTPLELPW